MISLPEHKQLILFDGVCNLCNNTVQYIIKHDKKDMFMFAALQSDIGKQLFDKFNFDTSKIDSILLYSNDTDLFSKSTAALKIAKNLKFPINLWSIFLVIPAFIRNSVYDYVAKNRYKWFGKRDNCMISTPEFKSKFLE